MAYKFDSLVDDNEKRNKITNFRRSILKFAEGVKKKLKINLRKSLKQESAHPVT